MATYFLILSYDGTAFNGWQAQKKASLRTVQETLEGAAAKIFGVSTPVTASGRTDAGVHALGQVCSFCADPLKERFCVRVGTMPDFKGMSAAAKLLEGEHDFKAFCAADSSAKTTVRTLYAVRLRREPALTGEEMRIYVTGNGFLYNMVRTIAGTLLDVGQGRKSLADVERALVAGDRGAVGRTMPAKGLCLLGVEYDKVVPADKNFTEIS